MSTPAYEPTLSQESAMIQVLTQLSKPQLRYLEKLANGPNLGGEFAEDYEAIDKYRKLGVMFKSGRLKPHVYRLLRR